MATLPEIAQATGLDPLVCGTCGSKLRTAPLLKLLFATILALLRDGRTVKIRGFGSFRPATHIARGFATGGPSKVVRFKLTRAARNLLNRKDPND